ncbi:MAG: hypothetical protein WC633_01855 [Desulfurivibrionaceae bacterium]
MAPDDRGRINFFDLLPRIYQWIDVPGFAPKDNEFLRSFLKPFEDLLLGQAPGESGLASQGLQEILERVHDYFDPGLTPNEFVEWLAGWVALDVSREVEEEEGRGGVPIPQAGQHFPFAVEPRSRKRRLIKKLAPLYHLLGTKEGLRQVIDIYFGDDLRSFHINELAKPFVIGDPEGLQQVRTAYGLRIGKRVEDLNFKEVPIDTLLARENYDALGAVVGRSTVVGEAPPYFFIVIAETLVPVSRVAGAQTKREMALVIDLEKPAHTYYAQKLRAPGMRVGIRDWCDIGRSTLIGGFEI